MRTLFELDYCPKCAHVPGDSAAAVGEAKVYLKVWIGNDEYAAEDTIKRLAEARDAADKT